MIFFLWAKFPNNLVLFQKLWKPFNFSILAGVRNSTVPGYFRQLIILFLYFIYSSRDKSVIFQVICVFFGLKLCIIKIIKKIILLYIIYYNVNILLNISQIFPFNNNLYKIFLKFLGIFGNLFDLWIFWDFIYEFFGIFLEIFWNFLEFVGKNFFRIFWNFFRFFLNFLGFFLNFFRIFWVYFRIFINFLGFF